MIDKKILDKVLNYLQVKCNGGVCQIEIQNANRPNIMGNNNDKKL